MRKWPFLVFLIITFILAFAEGKDADLSLKIIKEQEEKFWKDPEKNYIAWNIVVDYYTKLLQVEGVLEFQERLVKLHIEGALINSKNPNFFNFHYGYSPKYPLKVSVLNLRNYPKFNIPLLSKTLPLFVTIYNEGDETLDLSKLVFNLENISRSPEKLLNNDKYYTNLLKDTLTPLPLSKLLKPEESYSFILLFTYTNLPRIFRITVNPDIFVNIIFFENIPLMDLESSSPSA
ncbi:MAG TPA: hypothetical protein PKW23_03975 [Dictyoglomaceae bacterium]|nr:hypothetical protein [Dictyoglomaceae bacterium]HOL38752.1 hypothetical protein [Dictyoglomaceae bacterium]HOP94544.1 hypothetical protein [Dictyoglomaceae bacterium]HPP15499.1 hypothetical protein [Dictyoglomaceae bacterium]HPU43092.1 hypothetical protein [Dictyoglomaceae bacterium]